MAGIPDGQTFRKIGTIPNASSPLYTITHAMADAVNHATRNELIRKCFVSLIAV